MAERDEQEFQQGIRATPWFSEYATKYGEEPDLNTPHYDYRKAWAAGARPTVRDPSDQLLHWPSEFKGAEHPNRYVGGVDTITGQPMGELARQDTYDPFERAAARTRFGAKPLGGRQEGAATTLPENLLFAAPRAAAGFTQAAFDRAAEQTGDVQQLSTDYDPRRMGALLGAETAMNVVGLPALTGGVPASALGSGARGIKPAALPMDEASRMRRATEQGFTRDAYRGEGAPIEGYSFREGHPGRYDKGYLGSDAIYSTNAPRLANDYSSFKAYRELPGNEAPNVMPLKVKMENPHIISGEEKTRIAKMDEFERNDWLRDVYAKGHDGVLVKFKGGYEEYVAPAAQYRSRFAQFDPANKDSGFLLGSNFTDRKTGATLGALAATDEYRPRRDPNLWHDISRVRLPKPVSEMQATHVPTQAVKEKVITPAEMEGGWLLPAVGDRTSIGSNLTGYNGFMFANPVEMQGGHGFMAAQADKGLAWASNPGVITRIANKVKKLGAEGDPVYFPYTAMHNEGGDFSHHMSDTLSEAVKLSKLTQKAEREFNRTMKADHIDFGAVKNWPGIRSDNLREYLITAPGDVRNKFAKVMDTAKFQGLGFPSVAEARHAVTDPRLLDAPRGSAGLSISKMDPAGTAIPGASGHRTYSTDIAGNYIGGLARMIPRDVFYPDIVKGYEKLGSDPNLFMALGRTGAPIAQKATPKWVDSVSKWMEQNPRAAMKFTAGGVAATGMLGELARQDRYGTNSQ